MSLYFGPGAIASGVAETLAYVNGVNFPNFISWPTLITKCIGVSLAVAGDIKVGKEGPLAHIGSIIAVIILYIPWPCNRSFRNDRDKRIVVAAGAGVGVAAAFGAPIGGVLFSYETSKSLPFWTFGIAWRTFLATSMGVFILTLLEAAKDGNFDSIVNGGLLKFADITNSDYDLADFIVFIIIGILGGLLGSLYILINANLAKIRKYYLKEKYMKIIEAGLLAFIGATIIFFIPSIFN